MEVRGVHFFGWNISYAYLNHRELVYTKMLPEHVSIIVQADNVVHFDIVAQST